MRGKIWEGTPVSVPSNHKFFQGLETGALGRVTETVDATAETVLVTTKAHGTLRYPRELLRPAQF